MNMAKTINLKLDQCVEKVANQNHEAIRVLKSRLLNGEQTEGMDHQIIAKLLGIALEVHYYPGGLPEVVCEDPAAPRMHVRLMQKADGVGHLENHFDLLLPPPDSVPDILPSHPMSVTHAITIRGPEIAAAILSGHKDLENRRFQLTGWCALHLGRGDCDTDMRKQLHHLVPGLCPEAMPKGCVIGLVRFGSCYSLKDFRQEAGCGDLCQFPTDGLPKHHVSCKLSPFAIGPMINVITEGVIFHRGIPAAGALGRWELPDQVLKDIRKLVFNGECVRASNPDRPRNWPLPWLGRVCRQPRQDQIEAGKLRTI